MKKIGFIGAGNMGGALACAASKTENRLYISDRNTEHAKRLADGLGAECKDAISMVSECDMLFLGVKPNALAAVAAEIGDALKKRADICLVSMAAGVSLEQLHELFPCEKIIRIMPNTPASVGKGVILYALGGADGFDEQLLLQVLEHAGSLMRLDERLIDAATAVSGCGPAFVYMFAEALADGGVKCGLPRNVAMELACKTLIGASELCLESGKHPGELKDAVCSPGGSTIAGVAALERDGMRHAVIDAVESAYKRTKELSRG